MYIAIDAMGGDHAPRAVVEGAFLAAQEYGIAVLLVGDRGQITHELTRVGGKESALITVRHATEIVEMGESPVSALRRKRDSSLQIAFQAVKAGEASAVVSAGNTGAMLALAVTILGNLSGVDRPAIVTAVPALHGHTYLLDAGANIDCKPLHLVQFAVMGEIYARVVRGVVSPRVGVLSNGEEDSKGTDVTRAAHEMLKKLPLRYVGYVEGRDLNNGKVDVVITDGFTGNVALKTMEGFADFLQGRLRSVFTARWQNKLAYLLIRGSFTELRATLDPSEVGGAPLLGTDGLAIIAHGSSSPKAVKNAIRVADQAVRGGINRLIVESLHALPEATLAPADLRRGRKFWAQIKERFRHTREPHENPPTEPPVEEEKSS
jgi:glycerol-3-phosphate acyltransferase PlsX